MSVGGGLIYPGYTMQSPPRFTLYGDGRVMYAQSMGAGTVTSVEIRQARLTEEQVDQLLVAALVDGGLATASGHYSGGPYADDVTTTFEIHAAGIDKSVSVYGLGHEDESVPNLAIRRQMAELERRLETFGAEVAAGRVEDLGVYEPEAYLVTLDTPIQRAETHQGPGREWPWDHIQPTDFILDATGFRTRVMSAEDARQLSDPPTSAPRDIILAAPDGNRHLVRIRPLLPDEIP